VKDTCRPYSFGEYEALMHCRPASSSYPDCTGYVIYFRAKPAAEVLHRLRASGKLVRVAT
jgi:hypothetical protein